MSLPISSHLEIRLGLCLGGRSLRKDNLVGVPEIILAGIDAQPERAMEGATDQSDSEQTADLGGLEFPPSGGSNTLAPDGSFDPYS